MRFLFLGPIALVAARFLPEHPGISERQLLDAICQVESRGREDCADGDGGRSIGPFQISRSYWRDAVEFELITRRGWCGRTCAATSRARGSASMLR